MAAQAFQSARLEADSGPVTESARIISLDLIRGAAVLGILLMNAVEFKFGLVPHLNLSAGGSETWLDWSVGIFGEIFVDQKFMGLFSLLFGAGILLFIERAEAKDRRPILLNLWRNALLMAIGILHALLWEGDVLIVYAVSSLFLIAMRKLPPKGLIAIGAGVFLLSLPNFFFVQHLANSTDISLASLWTLSEGGNSGETGSNDALLGLTLAGYFLRGLGMILMGRTVPPGFHERRDVHPNLPADCRHRTRRRLTPCRRQRHRHGDGGLFQGSSVHRPGSQHAGHNSRVAGIHEPHRPLEPGRGQQVETAAPRCRQDGVDQLPEPDGSGGSRAHCPAERRGRESERDSALRSGRLGSAALVVASLARPFPFRPSRMAMACCDLSSGAAVAAGLRLSPDALRDRQRYQLHTENRVLLYSLGCVVRWRWAWSCK